MNFGVEGEKILQLYAEKLQITIDEARTIVNINKTAKALLKEELALGVTGVKKNLSALMRATLVRDSYDFRPLTIEEIQMIKQYYNIDISRAIEDKSDLQKAKDNFEKRLGVTYEELSNSKKAQEIARQNLDKETKRLREKFTTGR